MMTSRTLIIVSITMVAAAGLAGECQLATSIDTPTTMLLVSLYGQLRNNILASDSCTLAYPNRSAYLAASQLWSSGGGRTEVLLGMCAGLLTTFSKCSAFPPNGG